MGKTYKTEEEIQESNKKLYNSKIKRRHRKFNKLLEEQKLIYMQSYFDMLNYMINSMDKTIKDFMVQIGKFKEKREILRKQIQIKDVAGFEEEHFKYL